MSDTRERDRERRQEAEAQESERRKEHLDQQEKDAVRHEQELAAERELHNSKTAGDVPEESVPESSESEE
jgi:hypothetical protein